jgi:High potential iron-sulfur protein
MSESLSRREALKGFVLLIGAAGALSAASDSEGAAPMLVPLSPSDPDAVALAYHEDVKAVDPRKFPTYQLGQTCSNCVQGHGEDGAWHYCNLFRGKLVAANGWCKAWARRP